MAYNSINFFIAAGVYNACGYRDAPSINTYFTEDLIADVAAPGYFPDYFGFEPENVRVNDILFVQASDINIILLITDVAPVTLTTYVNFPTNIVTEDLSTQSQTASGVWSAPIAFTLDFVKQGSEVLMTFPTITDASTGGAVILFDAAIPAPLRPAFEFSCPITLVDNSLAETGVFSLDTSGIVRITRLNNVAFAATGDAAFIGTAIKYKSV